jgi:hypothetical protein
MKYSHFAAMFITKLRFNDMFELRLKYRSFAGAVTATHLIGFMHRAVTKDGTSGSDALCEILNRTSDLMDSLTQRKHRKMDM